MNLLRKTATTLGGIFFAVLLIAALAPKATRGVAAALVQVTNTASNAVPTEDGPGNFPFGATTCVQVESVACGSGMPSFLVPFATSTGAAVKRLVIEDVSASCHKQPGDEVFTEIFVPFPADNAPAFGSTVGFTLPYSFPLTSTGGDVLGVTHSPYRIYADPGAEINTGVDGSFTSTHGVSCLLSLTGHLETK